MSRIGRAAGACCCGALTCLLPLALPAQQLAEERRAAEPTRAPVHAWSHDAPASRARTAGSVRQARGSLWWTPLASAVIPGSGQARLSQDRFVAYLALEGYAWARYGVDLREGRRQRNRYRALARDVARAAFPGSKPSGNFDYYERMEHFVESGVFDLDPGGVLQPEVDTATYNGSLWLLARRTFWENPDLPPPPESPRYRQAIELYTARAATPDFQWSWRNAQLEHDVFRRTIDLSNEAIRRSILDLSVVLANHALSTVDAFITLRLRQRTEPTHGYRAEIGIPWAPFGHPNTPRAPSASR